MKSPATRLGAVAAFVVLTAGCASVGSKSPQASVDLQSRSGSSVTGKLTLQQSQAGVLVSGEVRGLAPGSSHGFHVHEKGDCSAPDASSAGPHFNPTGSPHGQMGSGAHHAGDMPNITADERGVAKVNVVVAGATLDPGASSISGRALVVHRDPDDYKTQPAGNAGPREACGVIPSPGM